MNTRRSTNRDSQIHNSKNYTDRSFRRQTNAIIERHQSDANKRLEKAIRDLNRQKAGRWGVI